MSAKTLGYILKRLGLAILTVWVVITATFFIMHAVPGGPFMSEKATTAAVTAQLEAKYGLDKPLMEQYFTYLKDIITKFDFGPSTKQRGRQVTDIIGDLLNDKLDGAFIETAVAENYAKNYPELVIVCDVPYDVAGSAIGVMKGNDSLMKGVNEAIAAALSDGSMDKFVAEANELSVGNVYEGLLDENGQVAEG